MTCAKRERGRGEIIGECLSAHSLIMIKCFSLILQKIYKISVAEGLGICIMMIYVNERSGLTSRNGKMDAK